MASTEGKTLARVAAHREIRRRIITLQLPPGHPLSENELARELEVSRTPVREGLLLLVEEDLVRVFPKLGSFVARVDPQRIADAQFVREAVEVASLTDAVEHRTDEDVEALRDLLRQQREAAEDVDRFFELDEAFHQRLLAAGGHANSWRTVEQAKAHLDRARRLGLRTVSPVSSLIDQHAEIVGGVESRDLDAAASALRGHLRAVFEDVERIRSESPELFVGSADERPVRRSITVLQ
ncbi:GntR family transcriptional regulator [Saccharopolyspora dendranthemae]|uniref:DNA-binding GntR family transcriptional regulator n=1 Tax=Saccharopolyspora dendranthemae TaxID=1181886 RepID=A0A561U2X5_9PSEU|nr:GntR family transcriptional regulator [Saccharopolyspora dendranthemae]TWF93706.1 DNA-binding GntR family transcriptional regulator [Saccharopolyspora dendranthemae]